MLGTFHCQVNGMYSWAQGTKEVTGMFEQLMGRDGFTDVECLECLLVIWKNLHYHDMLVSIDP